jgi:hypothetical protein
MWIGFLFPIEEENINQLTSINLGWEAHHLTDLPVE